MKQIQQLNKSRKTRMSFRKKVAVIGFALYLTFIFLSIVPYVAQHEMRSRQEQMDSKYDYYLVFTKDGVASHYDVTRVNSNVNGYVNLTYTTNSHSLEVTTSNIKKLRIDCSEVYVDESNDVFKQNPDLNDHYYYAYFAEEHDLFTVTVHSDSVIEELRFKKAPLPGAVYVDDDEWWISEVNYSYNENNDIVLTQVPEGTTKVEIYFNVVPPVAKFTVGKSDTVSKDEKLYGIVNKDISFDASESNDDADDGEIEKYLWTFGEITDTGEGKKISHKFDATGSYEVTLKVMDNHNLYDEVALTIHIVTNAGDLDEDGMTDEWEQLHGLDTTKDDSLDDKDRDKLKNIEEFENGTLPNAEDSDNDTYSDYDEIVIYNTKPLDSDSYPGKKKSGDDEGDDNNLLMMVILAVVLIIIIIIVFALLRKRKKEPEEQVQAPEQVVMGPEGGDGAVPPQGQYPEQPEGQMQMPPGPEQFEQPMYTGESMAMYQMEEPGMAEMESGTGIEEEAPASEFPEEGELPPVEEVTEPEGMIPPDEGLGIGEPEGLGLGEPFGDELMPEGIESERPYTPESEPEPPLYKAPPDSPYIEAGVDEDTTHDELARELEGMKISPEGEIEDDIFDPKSEELIKEGEEGAMPVKGPKKKSEKPEQKEEEAPDEETVPSEEEAEPEMTVKDYVKNGALHFKDGEYSDAIIEWQKALDLEPDHPEIVASIKEAMAKLKEQNE